jgi:probable rRNA maturation factor
MPRLLAFANRFCRLVIRLEPACNRVMDIVVNNRQRRIPVKLAWLRQVAKAALAECLRHSADGLFGLKRVPVVEVAVVSDKVIGEVHQEFMGIAGPTDVITFDHGEIVISAETAAVYAKEHGHSVDDELALYIVHGLLHLNGYDDTTAAEKKRMFRVQEKAWHVIRAGTEATAAQ